MYTFPSGLRISSSTQIFSAHNLISIMELLNIGQNVENNTSHPYYLYLILLESAEYKLILFCYFQANKWPSPAPRVLGEWRHPEKARILPSGPLLLASVQRMPAAGRGYRRAGLDQAHAEEGVPALQPPGPAAVPGIRGRGTRRREGRETTWGSFARCQRPGITIRWVHRGTAGLNILLYVL